MLKCQGKSHVVTRALNNINQFKRHVIDTLLEKYYQILRLFNKYVFYFFSFFLFWGFLRVFDVLYYHVCIICFHYLGSPYKRSISSLGTTCHTSFLYVVVIVVLMYLVVTNKLID